MFAGASCHAHTCTGLLGPILARSAGYPRFSLSGLLETSHNQRKEVPAMTDQTTSILRIESTPIFDEAIREAVRQTVADKPKAEPYTEEVTCFDR